MRITSGLRAIVSIPIGLFITFSQDHSSFVGLMSIAVFGSLVSFGLYGLIFRNRAISNQLPLAVVLSATAIAAIVGASRPEASQLAILGIALALFGLVSGALELYLASKAGFSSRSGRDFVISSVLSIALGALFLVSGLDVVSAVGFFGAFLMLYGVHWGIAATTVETK